MLAKRPTMAAERASHILLVDDLTIHTFVAEVLEDAGYIVSVAMHGAQALERMAISIPDLDLSDIMMPVMGGLELCRRIATTSQVPVILMSSAPPPETAGSGAVLVIPKPFDLDTLEAVVDQVLHRR